MKKVLSVYNTGVFRQLMKNPVEGIPRIYCICEENGCLTVIEEYISGDTLAELLEKNGPMSSDKVSGYIVELCGILEKLHSFSPPIIHRDIKPSNVIITPAGRVVLLDLNAARPDTAKEEDTMLLGTKGYAAPEQYGFGSSNIQTDIYAVGILMNTMLWGTYRRELFKASPLSPVIECCVKMDPRERYASVYGLEAAIKAAGGKAQKQESLGSEPMEEDWRRFLPPGFRTGTVWHMLVATPIYMIILWLCLTLNDKRAGVTELYFERFMLLAIFLSVICCSANYLDVQRIIPPFLKKNPVLRIIGILLMDVFVAASLMATIIFVETFVFGSI